MAADAVHAAAVLAERATEGEHNMRKCLVMSKCLLIFSVAVGILSGTAVSATDHAVDPAAVKVMMDIQQSHIEANLPATKEEFNRFFIRDLGKYFAVLLNKKVGVE